MKSYKFLFEKLIDKDNILMAIKNSSKRKRRRHDVAKVLSRPDEYIKRLQRIFLEGDYEKRYHKAVRIYDGNSKKERFIIQPEYIFEQIIHHAVIQVLKPILMRGMYDFSCGSIPNRGGTYGKKYLEKYIRTHNDSSIKYCLKLDIRHFYQTIDTELLKNKFRRIIKDKRMLDVIFYIIDSNTAECDGEIKNMGLPIGYYTSQWFANFFLQDFDHFIKEKLHIKCYVRYADDIVLFAPSKRELHKCFLRIKEFLKENHLEIKQNWQIFKFDYINKDGKRIGRPLDFMGYKFYRDKTTLRRHIFLSTLRTARRIYKKDKITWYDASQMVSYIGWFKRTNTHAAYEKHVKPFVNIGRCRKIISKYNKSKEKKENETQLCRNSKHG